MTQRAAPDRPAGSVSESLGQADGTEQGAQGYATIPGQRASPSPIACWSVLVARLSGPKHPDNPPHLFGTNTELSHYRSHVNCH
jgi:hypothetical protein